MPVSLHYQILAYQLLCILPLAVGGCLRKLGSQCVQQRPGGTSQLLLAGGSDLKVRLLQEDSGALHETGHMQQQLIYLVEA